MAHRDALATAAGAGAVLTDAEARIFRRCGLQPVFFGADPEWKKLCARPELSDPEMVSNISNAILRPLAASEIR